MHTHQLQNWSHDHVFNQHQKRSGEKRTLLVVILSAAMMVVEISAGLIYGSMALLADGLHMGSHTVALGLAVFAYVISRRLATDNRFAFGVGKINSLAGFASAILLLGFSLTMAVESTERLFNPVAIQFNHAIVVAVLGLLVNGISAWILIATPDHHHHNHANNPGHQHNHSHEHDHNLKGAYLHVLADALTSLLAIIALVAGKTMGAVWLDPVIGIAGALLVAKWSFRLIRETSGVLLDRQAAPQRAERLRLAIESDSSDRIADLHFWSIGPGIYAAELAIVSDHPQSPGHYKAMIPEDLSIVHLTVEVHHCATS